MNRPAKVDETVRTDTVVEVQPIIHRDVERTVINHIEQHIQEPEAPFVGGSYRNQPIIDEHVHAHAVEGIYLSFLLSFSYSPFLFFAFAFGFL